MRHCLMISYFVFQWFLKRTQAASEEEREVLQQLDVNYMSDEEDGDGDNSGCWVVRSLPWRGPHVTEIVHNVQQRLDEKNAETASKFPRNKRVDGPPSSRLPPANAPTWAVQAVVDICNESPVRRARPPGTVRRAALRTPESSPRGVLDDRTSPEQSPLDSPSRSRSRSPPRRSPRLNANNGQLRRRPARPRGTLFTRN